MELRYLLGIIRANLRFLGAVSVVACLLALTATYILPERFESSTTVLIRPEKKPSFTASSPTIMDYPVSFAIPAESMSQTYASLMTNEAMAMKIVDRLKLDRPAPPRDTFWLERAALWCRNRSKQAMVNTWEFLQHGRLETKDPYREAVEKVLRNLEAKPVPDTYLFTVTATWNDPDIAKQIANTAASVFVEASRDANRDEEGTSAAFLGDQLVELKDKLAGARGELQQFEQQTQATALEQQLSLRLASLAEFEKDRENTIKQASEARAEIAELRTQLAAQSAEVHGSTTMARNPAIDDLEQELARDEVELAGLSETHQKSHPRVQALMARIDATRRKIADQQNQVHLQDTSAINPVHSEVEGRLLEREATRDALQARLKSLDETVTKYRAGVAELTDRKSEFARLNLDVRVLEDQYQVISKQYAESRMGMANDISEIRVLNPAVAPVYPEGPIKVYYAGGGLMLGFLVALSFLLTLDYADPRIRSREDAARILNAPVLATLPHAGASRPLTVTISLPNRTSTRKPDDES